MNTAMRQANILFSKTITDLKCVCFDDTFKSLFQTDITIV